MQFSQIIEQHNLINYLIRVYDQRRVSHAQLFFGEEASKSFALTLAYAQFLNCSNKIRYKPEDNNLIIADSCGKCPSCKKFSTLSHPDLHFIFPNTTTKRIDSKSSSELLISEFREFVLKQKGLITINDWYDFLDVGNKQGTINVRDANSIIKVLSVKSYEAKYKIMIIWCVDKLYYDAAPKLLKILEEPYEDTIFLLITDDRENILPTILSRTQLVKIPKLSQKIEKDNKYLILFVEWLRNCFLCKTKIADVVKIIEKDIVNIGREEQKQFLGFALEVFQNSFAHKIGIPTKNSLLENCDDKFKSNFPSFITENNIEQIYKELDRSILHIERNGNAKMIFLDLSIKLGFLLTIK
ncbi:MAG: hypothetical protein M0O93_03560 [Bacteroidales bacterium]|nr:hypothetical protein [Bacteroidales bacterium]